MQQTSRDPLIVGGIIYTPEAITHVTLFSGLAVARTVAEYMATPAERRRLHVHFTGGTYATLTEPQASEFIEEVYPTLMVAMQLQAGTVTREEIAQAARR